MMCSLKIIVFFVTFSLSFEHCFGKCGRSKYETDEGCCPKCEAGTRVHNHCNEDTTTSCAQCPESTYTAEPNGLKQCTKCTACNLAQGLKVKTPCTRSSDTACEPREGHYCTDHNTNGCIQAVKHRQCRPGEYIKLQGTAVRDAECDECANGTYSDGSFQSCRPHSNISRKAGWPPESRDLMGAGRCSESCICGFSPTDHQGGRETLHSPCILTAFCGQCSVSTDEGLENDQHKLCSNRFRASVSDFTSTRCEGLGRTEIKAGTRHSDTECVIKLSAGAIAGFTLFSLVILVVIAGALAAVILCLKKKFKTVQPTVNEVKAEPEQCKTEKVEFWSINFLNIIKMYEDDAPPSIQKC